MGKGHKIVKDSSLVYFVTFVFVLFKKVTHTQTQSHFFFFQLLYLSK